MIELTEQQNELLSAAIDLALSSWEHDPENETLNPIYDALLAASRDDLRIVMFGWHDRHGRCYECGLPAAFRSTDSGVTDESANLLCAVCAANRAAVDGETIERIEEL